ncbi:S-adenosylmethionine:tRNA ribosyltransferase-isomerase [Streptomyces cyaneus]|uniref:S-adenosylmethionine:tRNA ribosyltransferase-isomerase n=1 Tax=Streptomyces cyaneus TaxID=1904 RepID=UPI003CCC8A09
MGTGPQGAGGTGPQDTGSPGPRGARGAGPQGAMGTGAQGAGGAGPHDTGGTGLHDTGSAAPAGAMGTDPDRAGGTRPQDTGSPGPRGTGGTRPQGAMGTAPQLAGSTGPQPAGGTGPQDTESAGPQGSVVLRLMREYGRPIRYSYTERDQPLSVYQTVFALPSADGAGSAEMPSAARPFTVRMVTELVSRGVQFAPIMLHTGVASAEAHEPPYPERFAVPEASARLINAAKATDGRIVAVGTTAVRAVESAAGADGVVRAREGWTDLVVTPERGVRVVDGLLTGLHEPEASHLLMLEAVAGRAAIDRSYDEALRGLYLWHEFGDVHLILPTESPHSEHCASNCR